MTFIFSFEQIVKESYPFLAVFCYEGCLDIFKAAAA